MCHTELMPEFLHSMLKFGWFKKIQVSQGKSKKYGISIALEYATEADVPIRAHY